MNLNIKLSGGLILVLLIGSLCLCTIVSHAQGINYSQYRNAPYYTNPGLLGAKSEVSLSVIHRSQQLTSLEKYNTSSLMAVVPLVDSKTGRRWGGWGLSAVNDEIKGGPAYRMQGISGAYAYNLPISKGYYISFGMQGGYYQRKIAVNGLTTSSQWSARTGFDPSVSTGEAISGQRKNYFSLGAGFLFYAENEDHRQVAQFGVAAFNINQPNASFLNDRDVIPAKITAMGSLALMQSAKHQINGEMLYYRENGKNTYHVGSRLSYYFDNKNPFDALKQGSVDFKAGYRVNNAITTEIQFHQPNFTVGFGYDFGIASRDSRSGANNVVEILFVLKKFIKSAKKNSASTSATSYSTIGEIRDFYFDKKKQSPTPRTEEPEQAEETQQEVVSTSDGDFEFKLKHDFRFGFNEATLNDESKAYLDDMVKLLQGNKNFMLEVIGHTDNVGTHDANRTVSLKRARVVVDYLIQSGIEPRRLKATPMGAKEPVAPNDTEENRAKNRRVEFVIRDLQN